MLHTHLGSLNFQFALRSGGLWWGHAGPSSVRLWVWGWNSSSGFGLGSVFQYSLTERDGSGSGFGSGKTVLVVPVPCSLPGKRLPTVPVSSSGSVFGPLCPEKKKQQRTNSARFWGQSFFAPKPPHFVMVPGKHLLWKVLVRPGLYIKEETMSQMRSGPIGTLPALVV